MIVKRLIVSLMLVQCCIGYQSFQFYHEPSSVFFKPKDNDKTYFGYSMGYQENGGHLIVGSPHRTGGSAGRVYKCNLDSQSCTAIIDEKSLKKSDPLQDTNSWLGASIATIENNIMSCAPLWTDSIPTPTSKGENLAYGTCFVYPKSGKIFRLQGLSEQKKSVNANAEEAKSIYGGVGWNLLADRNNNVTFIGKPFLPSDIQYVDTADIENEVSRNSNSLYYNRVIMDRDNKDNSRRFNLQSNTMFGYALAAGNFFSPNETSYAFSGKDFLRNNWKVYFMHYRNKEIALEAKDIQSQYHDDIFGASLWGDDLDGDKLTDLIVGAPASVTESIEVGAVYIYLGKYLADLKFSQFLRIVGLKPRSRFGAAIATSNLDDDKKPELIIAAPYEGEDNSGAVYILSGLDLNSFYKNENNVITKNILEFKYIQTIRSENTRLFGFSLQVVKDINDNGCDELAVGMPGNNTVFLIKCIPAVKVTITSERSNNTEKGHFVEKVCAEARNKDRVNIKLQVECSISGDGDVQPDPKEFVIDLNSENLCHNVSFKLDVLEPGSYSFEAKATMNTAMFKSENFDTAWVQPSLDSKLTITDELGRFCKEQDCDPKLDLTIVWDGSVPPKEITVREKILKNVTLNIWNEGQNAHNSCVIIQVSGFMEHVPCQLWETDDKEDNRKYKCDLPRIPRSIERDGIQKNILVNIDRAVGDEDMIHIMASLYSDCDNKTYPKEVKVDIKVLFIMHDVLILGNSRDFNITDVQINNEDTPTTTDTHTYEIFNNGTLIWESVHVVILIRKKDFISKSDVYIKDTVCEKINEIVDFVKFNCLKIKLFDKTNLTVDVIFEIPNNEITKNLVDGKLEIESKIEVRMSSTNNTNNMYIKSLKTTVYHVKETYSVANDMTVVIIIAIVVAFLILAAFVGILYKVGFFKRKQKQQLDSFRASVKSKSSTRSPRPSTVEANEVKPEASEDNDIVDIDMEVIEDDAFDLVPINPADDAALITEHNTDAATSKNTSRRPSQVSDASKKDAAPRKTSYDAPWVVVHKEDEKGGSNKE